MEEIENEFVKFWIEEGILINELKKPIHVTLEIAIEMVELRHIISNEEYQYFCMGLTKVRSFSKEASNYVDKYGQYLLYASGAVVNSEFTKTLFNTYVKLRPPKIPFKAFTSLEKAIKWLRELKEKNESNIID